MKRSVLLLGLLAQVLLSSSVLAAPAPREDGRSVRRFALLLASNYGGPERVTLKYAYDDATAFSEVLEELGGLSVNDRRLLMEPDQESLKEGMAWLATRLSDPANKGLRREVLFYYSGHSDEGGLLPGGRRIPYTEVRRLLSGLDCEVRIAVLDSCAAGAMTRMKGGSWTAPFLVDQSSQVRGQAILTSASADEAAQESDRIRASLFTHHMVTGLRGAADVDGDSLVTLNEAYRHAYKETLENSESTRAGAQHPAYDFQLAGAGDLVLTDLTDNPGSLLLPSELEGRIFIRGKGGRLVAEFGKVAGKTLTLGLKPGEYSVAVLHGGVFKKVVVEVKQGQSDTLAVAAMKPAPLEELRTRGNAEASPDDPGPVTYRKQAASLVIIPAMGDEPLTDNNFTVNVLGRAHDLDGAEFSLVGGIRTGHVDGVQFGGFYNQADGRLRGVQGSNGINILRGPGYGVQGAFVNYAGAGFHGVQGSFVNVADGGFGGVQGAFVNVNKAELSGVQGAFVNVNQGTLKGVQAGFVNVGAQVKGVQLGFVNVARKSSLSLGLVSVNTEGRSSLTVGGGDLAPAALEFKHGGDHWHTIYRVGAFGDGWDSQDFAFGLGGHIPLPADFFLDLDVLSHYVRDSELGFSKRHRSLGEGRLQVGYHFLENLAVVAGGSFNVLVQEGNQQLDRYARFGGWNYRDGGASGTSVFAWPGFFAGLKLGR